MTEDFEKKLFRKMQVIMKKRNKFAKELIKKDNFLSERKAKIEQIAMMVVAKNKEEFALMKEYPRLTDDKELDQSIVIWITESASSISSRYSDKYGKEDLQSILPKNVHFTKGDIDESNVYFG